MTSRPVDNVRNRERGQKRREDGRCTRCANLRGEHGTSWYCRPCADAATRRQMAYLRRSGRVR